MRDELNTMRTLLAVLLDRAGGTISFTEEELEEATGNIVYDQEIDKAGFTHLHLLPDYVHTGLTKKQIAAEKREAKEKAEQDARLFDIVQQLKKSKRPFVSPSVITGTSTNIPASVVGWSTSDVSGTPVTSGGVKVGTVPGPTMKARGWEWVRESTEAVPMNPGPHRTSGAKLR